MTISTAESCTGGRIAAAITAHSGASNYFQGGLVAYQNEVKEQMLGVPKEMIDTYGVVSREVAEQMVKGACRLFHTDYAMASTGSTGSGVRGDIGLGQAALCADNADKDRVFRGGDI